VEQRAEEQDKAKEETEGKLRRDLRSRSETLLLECNGQKRWSRGEPDVGGPKAELRGTSERKQCTRT
jgi:hypothetical protein